MHRTLELQPLNANPNHDLDTVVWVNPLNLDTVSMHYLDQLLSSSRASGLEVLDEFVAYPAGITGKKVSLSHTLVHRTKIHPITHKIIHLYSIEGAKLGSGKYGSAYAVIGALEHKTDGHIIYTEKPRVLKIQDESFWSEIESENAVNFPHLHAKPATISNASSTKKIYILMKRFKGEDLASLLQRKRNGLQIPPEKLLRITINILRALEEQIHFYGYVHRDIKPANIMVNFATCEVSIIDVGFTRKEKNDDHHKPGSPGYYAPEVVTEKFPYDKSSDRYALGLALRELWGAPPRKGTEADVFLALKAEKEPAALDISHLKNSGLSAELNAKALELFKELTHLEPSHRSLSDAAERFESIETAHKINKQVLSLDEKGKILAAHAVANGVREKLRDHFTTGHRFYHVRKQILSEVYEPLSILQNHPAIIEEYARILGITHLQDETCKFTLIDNIQQIFQDFDNHVQLLDQLNSQLQTLTAMLTDPIMSKHVQGIDRNDLADLQNDVALLIYRHQNKAADLNIISQFNARVRTKLLDLDIRFGDLTSKVFNGEAKQALSSYNSILNLRQRLQVVENSDDDLALLKNNVKSAIMLYISSTLTFDNLKTLDRAGSSRRQVDIDGIITEVNSARSYKSLLNSLELRISKLETGFLGRSELRDQLNTAIKMVATKADSRRNRSIAGVSG